LNQTRQEIIKVRDPPCFRNSRIHHIIVRIEASLLRAYNKTVSVIKPTKWKEREATHVDGLEAEDLGPRLFKADVSTLETIPLKKLRLKKCPENTHCSLEESVLEK
jgi:hypothetical protein